MSMKKLSSLQLRIKFFDYFVKLGHKQVASSSLIPAQDPTILFTNAGMNQFKDQFLGLQPSSFKRAVSIQKCVRAGGKHNDLENVGFTQRHLTFFEMMGNFSFGDYFKKEAIAYAWNFLTQEVGFDPKNMYVSVHVTDQESYDIWHQTMGIAPERIFKLGESNFWQMGDVGPCGPCTEIFVDRGPSYGCGSNACDLACGCDRFLEVWNNVFMQFNRQADGTDIPLKQTGVDTGMGLERLCMIVQGTDSVFTTDLFSAVFSKIETLTNYQYQTSNADIQAAFNVLGDHVRSATFLIADGCAPSNDGRGYVLRKIIRRAALFAQKLTKENIFPQVACALIEDMKSVYPELVAAQDRIVSVLKLEIERFSDNLIRGKKILQEYIASHQNSKLIDGAFAFMLYDTYGFPLEVTKLIAHESGFIVDIDGFERHMQEQKERSGKKMKHQSQDIAPLFEHIKSEFTGYHSMQQESSVIAILHDDQLVESVSAGTQCWIVAAKTPFYVACGGQVDDKAVVNIAGHLVPVMGLKKVLSAILIQIQAPTSIKVGDQVAMTVDSFARLQTMKNHTATHLLQAALQQLFGKSVKQAGSLVTPEYLRFDYTHHQALSDADIVKIEEMVNQKIWDNIAVRIENMSYKKAIEKGVIAFFGEKYNQDDVRAVFVDDFSAELCGGTHVRATGDIGVFKIVEDSALAAGQRRIVALTGYKAMQAFQQDFGIVKKLTQDLKCKSDGLVSAVLDLQTKLKDAQKDLKAVKMKVLEQALDSIVSSVEVISSIPFAGAMLEDCSIDQLRELAQKLQKQKIALYLLLSVQNGKTVLMACIDKSLSEMVRLSELKEMLHAQFGMQTGGSVLILQGGGPVVDAKKLIDAVSQWLKK